MSRQQDAAIARVRALHSRAAHGGYCEGCIGACYWCEGDHPWPCPTIQALDGPPPAVIEGEVARATLALKQRLDRPS